MPKDILYEQPFLKRLGDRKLLDSQVLDDLPTEHTGDTKYMAVRFKIKHETRKRLTPGARKKYWEKAREGEGETWLHISPDTKLDMVRCVTCAVPRFDDIERPVVRD